MGRRVFREMFRVVENLTALLATILIGGHDAPPTCMVPDSLPLVCQRLPATWDFILGHRAGQDTACRFA